MDTALANGTFVPGQDGKPKLIGGTEELLQRAMIRLNVRRGNFVYHPDLGSGLAGLQAEDENWESKALSMAQEALKELPQLSVASVRPPESEGDPVVVTVVFGGESAEIEVR